IRRAHEEIAPVPTVLLIRQIELRRRRPGQTAVSYVANDADDLPSLWVAVILIRADVRDVFADRVFVREVTAGESLVDNGRADDASTAILFGDVAAFQQGNPDRLKVLRGDAAVVGVRLLTGLRIWAALDSKITAHIAAAERHRRDERGALDAGQATESFERLIDVAQPLFMILISRSRKTDPARQHVHCQRKDERPRVYLNFIESRQLLRAVILDRAYPPRGHEQARAAGK